VGRHRRPGAGWRDHEGGGPVRLRDHVRRHLLRLVPQRARLGQHQAQAADDPRGGGRRQELTRVTGQDVGRQAAACEAIAFDWGGVMTRGTFDSSAVVALAGLYGMAPGELQPTYLRLMEGFEVGEYDMAG